MIFTTLNSRYEVDLDGLRIRRLSGVNPPLASQVADGVWLRCLAISPIVVGQSVVATLDNPQKPYPHGFRTTAVETIEAALSPQLAEALAL